MIVMPVVNRSDLRWSPYHEYLGNKTWVMVSLYYLPKKRDVEIKKYLSQGDIDESIGHFSLEGMQDANIFIDNGVFTIVNENNKIRSGKKSGSLLKIPTPTELAQTFNERVTGGDYIAAGPDIPINLSNFTIDEKIERARQTVKNMEEFLTHYKGDATPVAVIQAMGVEMAVEQAKQYKNMGYSTVAIGTMGNAVSEELLQQSKEVSKLGMKVHIFGATPPNVLPLLNYYDINMADSHSPLRWSMYGQILDPETYKLVNTNEVKPDEWSCDCPVCSEYKDRVLNPTTTRIADIRAVHNLLTLQKAAEDKKLRRHVLEAQIHYKKTSACKNCKRTNNIGACAMKKYRGECLFGDDDYLSSSLDNS